jgi:predicted kinase
MLVIFRGLPGTGKTWLARQLQAERPDFLALSRDALRKSIFLHPSFSPEEKDLVDELILSMTGTLLAKRRGVLIDGMALSSARHVQDFVDAAVSRGSPWRIIECVCSEKTALARITRDAGKHPAGDRGPGLYFAVKARFQPVDHASLVVDTDGDSAENIAAVLRFLAPPPVV